MLESTYKVIVKVENKDVELTGSLNIENNTHFSLDLPEGTIEDVCFLVNLQIDKSTKIFMNGFTSATFCPEYNISDMEISKSSLNPILNERYLFDRYGDYHIYEYPRVKGIFHGYSYCYFRNNDNYNLFASLNEDNGYTIFIYNCQNSTLQIRKDCKGIKCNGNTNLLDIINIQGKENDVFDNWFKELNIKPRQSKQLFGYSTFYNKYSDIDEQDIAEEIYGSSEILSKDDLYLIEDGWQSAVGDWFEISKDKFEDPMEDVINEIHLQGLKAGLWLAPFICEQDSQIYNTHKEWVLKYNDQEWCAGANWSGTYSLDFENKEFQKYLKKVFERFFNEWKIDFVKVDLLYAACPFGDENETRAYKMKKALQLLRELCGDKLLITSSTPLFPAFGISDYCSIGPKSTLKWDDGILEKLMHRERRSTYHLILNNIFRRQLRNRAFLVDGDTFFIRDNNCKFKKNQKEIVNKFNMVLTDLHLTSDTMSTYSAIQKQAYKDIIEYTKIKDISIENDKNIIVKINNNGKQEIFKI